MKKIVEEAFPNLLVQQQMSIVDQLGQYYPPTTTHGPDGSRGLRHRGVMYFLPKLLFLSLFLFQATSAPITRLFSCIPWSRVALEDPFWIQGKRLPELKNTCNKDREKSDLQFPSGFKAKARSKVCLNQDLLVGNQSHFLGVDLPQAQITRICICHKGMKQQGVWSALCSPGGAMVHQSAITSSNIQFNILVEMYS